jgi:hypothetical protein
MTAWTHPQACYADCNGDGLVNLKDLKPILRNWHATLAGGPAPFEDPGMICRQLLEALDSDPTVPGVGVLREALLKLMTEATGRPLVFSLEPNVPNPFAERTTFRFILPERTPLTVLRVYDVGGTLLREISRPDLPAGFHSLIWDGRDQMARSAPAGLYFYVFSAGADHAAGKTMLLR